MYVLYLDLENYIHSSWSLSDLPENSYIKTETGIYLRNIKSGIYGKFRIQDYFKIPAHYSKQDVENLYPQLKNLEWPCSIGRYEIDYNTVDVIFGKEVEEMKNLRTSPIDPKWSFKSKTEYLFENYGFWHGWSYNLSSASLAYLTMQLIQDIPANERTPLRVVRHITAMTDQMNNSYGILYGKWDGIYTNGKQPYEWKSVIEIMNYRFYTGHPVKYAQCWIFAEVLTAMFRFLGIPARTVYVKNAHIDTGCDGGIDYLDITCKGEKILKKVRIHSLLTDINEVYYDSETVEKGDTENSKITVQNEKINLLDLVKRGDRSWNFHVWSECFLDRSDIYPNKLSWNICDPCPVPEVKTNTYDDYNDKHFFGPCSIHSIKEGLKYPYDFEYLHSAINSVLRQWAFFQYENITIVFPYKINYNMLKMEETDVKKVELYTRNIELSQNVNMVKEEITSEYRYSNYSEAYAAYHRNYPILFAKGHNDELKYMVINFTSHKYLIQIIHLLKDNVISKCYRKIYDDISKPLVILPKTADVVKISTLIIDLDTKEFYPQII
jgi:hypothetical protein